MCFLCDGDPIIRRYVRVETESNRKSRRCAVDPYTVASRQDRAQCTASARDAKTVPLCDARTYDEGLLGQQLGFRKAMLAFVFLLPATCRERPALAAALVLLVVMVLHSGLIVLQHLVELFGIVVRACRQVVHAAMIRPDVGFLSVLPYALRYVAELLVVFEGGPLLLDGVCLPLVLVGVRVRFTADP